MMLMMMMMTMMMMMMMIHVYTMLARRLCLVSEGDLTHPCCAESFVASVFSAAAAIIGTSGRAVP
eukprot:5022403-Karenia_brevis.AAC.1